MVISLKVEIIKVGILECNCYLIINDENILIIDPGDEAEKIKTKIGTRNVAGIIITHHHYDHDGASINLANYYNTKIYDRFNLNEGINQIKNFKFEVIYTPGHNDDLITIYFKKEKIMFCGDFIFKDSIGRIDLPGGNISDMQKSLTKIKNYDRDITIYPGHGPKTTLGYEINNNIYFQEWL